MIKNACYQAMQAGLVFRLRESHSVITYKQFTDKKYSIYWNSIKTNPKHKKGHLCS